MNSTERVLTALKRKIPDRVPTFELVIDSKVIDAIIPGADLSDFVDNPELVRGIIEKAVDYYSELGKLSAKLGAEIAFIKQLHLKEYGKYQ